MFELAVICFPGPVVAKPRAVANVAAEGGALSICMVVSLLDNCSLPSTMDQDTPLLEPTGALIVIVFWPVARLTTSVG